MKRLGTLLLMSVLVGFQLSAQAVLWGGPNDPNSTFANGLGAWTTIELGSSAGKALWTYSASGTSKGYYSDLSGSIISPSSADGAAIFDSDFLDNGGIADNDGNGSAPAPHKGALVSPVIDCSTFSSVSLAFYQYYQNYTSTCTIEVTSDEGKTWTSFPVNEEVRFGTGTYRNNKRVVDITSAAALKSKMQFRFVFEGDGYFWTIDDVTLIELPDNDLALITPYYFPFTYAQPKSQICNDEFKFSTTVSNLGKSAQKNALFKVEILDKDRTTVLFTDETQVANMDPTDDNITIKTNKTFIPNNLDFGKYYIRWTFNGGNTPDYNPNDNVRTDSFEITVNSYSREPGIRTGVRANERTAFVVASQYRTPNCWTNNDRFKVTNVEMAFAVGRKASINGYTTNIGFYKIKDEVSPNFLNFDREKGLASTSIEAIANQAFTGTNESSFTLFQVPLKNDQGADIELAANTRYFLTCSHPEEPSDDPDSWHFHAASLEKNYEGHPFAVPVIDNEGYWLESWPDGDAPVLRLSIGVITKTDDHPLDESVLNISPNPVQNNEVKFNLKFGKATDANITLFDMNGKVLNFEPHKSVLNQTISLSTLNLASGEYFIRVSTQEGTKTKMFSVIK